MLHLHSLKADLGEVKSQLKIALNEESNRNRELELEIESLRKDMKQYMSTPNQRLTVLQHKIREGDRERMLISKQSRRRGAQIGILEEEIRNLKNRFFSEVGPRAT